MPVGRAKSPAVSAVLMTAYRGENHRLDARSRLFACLTGCLCGFFAPGDARNGQCGRAASDRKCRGHLPAYGVDVLDGPRKILRPPYIFRRSIPVEWARVATVIFEVAGRGPRTDSGHGISASSLRIQ